MGRKWIFGVDQDARIKEVISLQMEPILKFNRETVAFLSSLYILF